MDRRVGWAPSARLFADPQRPLRPVSFTQRKSHEAPLSAQRSEACQAPRLSFTGCPRGPAAPSSLLGAARAAQSSRPKRARPSRDDRWSAPGTAHVRGTCPARPHRPQRSPPGPAPRRARRPARRGRTTPSARPPAVPSIATASGAASEAPVAASNMPLTSGFYLDVGRCVRRPTPLHGPRRRLERSDEPHR